MLWKNFGVSDAVEIVVVGVSATDDLVLYWNEQCVCRR